MTAQGRLFLHVGSPRTATTALQAGLFPNMRLHHYFGKRADNAAIRGTFKPVPEMKQAARAIRYGDTAKWKHLRKILPSTLNALKVRNHLPGDAYAPDRIQLAKAWTLAMDEGLTILDDKSVVFSDESLVESISGLIASLERGDAIPLEQLQATGLLEKASVSMVVREPQGFLKASYYKAMEFRANGRRATPLSFDEYIVRQMRIHDRCPRASRIYLCDFDAVSSYLHSVCASARVLRFEEFVRSRHPLDNLFGRETGEVAVPFDQLPKENSSWRDPRINEFILSAPGVPAGITIDEYARTFPEVLARHSLDKIGAAKELTS